MRKSEPNYRLKSGIGVEQPRSFTETVGELLMWQKNEFLGGAFKGSTSKGKEEIRSSFISQEGFEDNPEKMIRILDFLTSKMKIDDGGQLRKMLSELQGSGSVSILPTDEKSPPAEVLRRLLTGKYDKILRASEIAEYGKVYTLALYLYMHTSGDSEEEIVNVLTKLIGDYDDELAGGLDEYGINGLKAEPFLSDLCAMAIEKHGLGETMRGRFKHILDREESPNDDTYERNVRSVFEKKI